MKQIIQTINYEQLLKEIHQKIEIHPDNTIHLHSIIDHVLAKQNINLPGQTIEQIAEIISQLDNNIKQLIDQQLKAKYISLLEIQQFQNTIY
jgi:methyl coenzyme M reductase subunit C